LREIDNNNKIFPFLFSKYRIFYVPGDSRNIENTIIDNTAEITSNAMQIPRQFLFSVDDIASSLMK
jgi:hypothetical protein